ncbi:MAG TPA: TetR/AcrR family transcriptional regulator [Sporichthyaceae bacterium]|jgi:AcrR family transcriptional regulator|nr:TetR/AcrR family transcriptional regulator [Sporichthyaceae bacterium]
MRTNTRTKQRLEPEAFYNAGFKLLGERGAEELTIDSLCVELGVAKGSFYHHFANTAEFTTGLLAAWESTFYQAMELSMAIGDPARQLEAIWPTVLRRPHEAEAALRAWGRSNPLVSTVVRRVDQKLEQTAADWLNSFLDDPERSRLLAWMWLSLITGMQQRQPLDRRQILLSTVEFFRSNVGFDLELHADDRLTVRKVPGPDVRTAVRRSRATASARKPAERPKSKNIMQKSDLTVR